MMKNKVLLGLIGVLALVGWVNAATLRVPTEYPTVTAALDAADPGDTIEVAATYDSADAGEVFPITVTKDDISIICEEGAIFRVPSSSAGFVFYKVEGGALKYAEITSEENFKPEDATTLGDVGVLIKESSGVVVEGNVIHDLLSGIRLILASGNTITDNELYNIGRVVDGKRTGIGIFLEKSNGNTLSGNEVYDSGEGLFLFESHNNTVLGDSYHDNDEMGVNLNDSDENTLEDLDVADNGTWGVRFMFADKNVLRDSEIAGNQLGGVELAASSENEIRDNYIHDNGTSTQDDNIQVVVTGGDKAIFRAPDAFKAKDEGPIAEIRAEKEFVEQKVAWLRAWIDDLDYELEEIVQKVATAIGMIPVSDSDCETIATGDGSTTTFTGTLTFPYLEPFSVFFSSSYQTDSQLWGMWVYDDGAGNLTGDGSGTIDYGTGAYSVTFDHPPAVGEPVTACYVHLAEDLAPEDIQAVKDKIEDALAELDVLGFVILTRGMLDRGTPGSGLLDPAVNFTLPDSTHPFAQKVDPVTGQELPKPYWEYVLDQKVGPDTGWGWLNLQPLDRDGPDGILGNDDDEVSYGKFVIIEIVKWIIRYEVYQIEDKIDDAWENGLISQCERDELYDKLDAILGYLDDIDFILFLQSVRLNQPGGWGWFMDGGVAGYTWNAESQLYDALDDLDDELVSFAWFDLRMAKNQLEAAIWAKQDVYTDIERILHKLELVNEELPPDLAYNVDMLAKKEKPGLVGITEGEIDDIIEELVGNDETEGRLNKDALAQWIRSLNVGDPEFEEDDIEVEHVGFTHSTGNLIAGNVITTDVVTNGLNIGIKLESPGNVVVNNVFTNDDLEHGRAGFYGTLDRAIEMLSSGNLVAYNLIEWVNIGIVRGGEETRKDVQQEYYFLKIAKAAVREVCGEEKVYLAIAVLEKKSSEIPVTVDAMVKNNRIALNLFDHCGIGIDIVDAESNVIDENVFYNCTDGGIVFELSEGKEVGPHIVIEHNDFVGGLSVVNEGATSRDARDNFALNSPTSGPVIEPAAEEPFCYDNFGKIDKFEELGIEEFFNAAHPTFPPMAQGSDLRRLVVAGKVFILPEEKPRVCDDIFGEQPQPTGECIDLPAGWNLISMWIEPEDPTPEAVFDEVPGILYLYRWDPDIEGWLTAHEGTLTQVSVLGGYWLWLPEPTTVCVTGTEVTGDQEIPLGKAGWQMIGVPYPVAWGDVVGVGSIRVRNGAEVMTLAEAVAAGWLYHTVWEYDTAAGEWITTTLAEGTTLVPEKGYYIYTYVDNLTLLLSEMPTPGPIPTPTLALMGEEDLGTPPAPVVPASEATLEIANFPNPITDVHTTTFKVLGPMASQVEEMRVRIFDLAGRLVWEGEAYGPELVWHTENLAGQYLANGVYLYQVQVKVGGTWITTSLKKLAIYR